MEEQQLHSLFSHPIITHFNITFEQLHKNTRIQSRGLQTDQTLIQNHFPRRASRITRIYLAHSAEGLFYKKRPEKGLFAVKQEGLQGIQLLRAVVNKELFSG